MIPDGVEPSLPGSEPGVVPLDHGTVFHAVDSPRVALGFSACGADVFLLDDEPIRSKVPGVGIEPTSSWFRARRHYQQQLPRIALSQQTRAGVPEFGEKDLNLHRLVQGQAAYR